MAGAARADRDDREDRDGRRRDRMVERQIAARGVTDPAVLEAMRTVPRHRFAPEHSDAYGDAPIPIGHGATVSQPYIVALMVEVLRLRPDDRVLEVGTGSGYGAAVLGRIAPDVTTVEVVPELAATAAERLADLAPTVRVVVGDGSAGYPDGAPYDAICVTAAAREVPRPLLDQLADGGRLVIPVGAGVETLTLITRHGDRLEHEELLPVRFVPLRTDRRS